MPIQESRRPSTPAATKPAAPTGARPQPKPQAAVPGEIFRTVLSLSSSAMSPMVQAPQTLAVAERATFTSAGLARATGAFVRVARAIGELPIINNPVVRTACGVAGRLFPFVNAGILAFDAYATYATLTSPDASTKRKALVSARFVANAVSTAFCFVPGWGALASMGPAWLSIGLDLYVKRMNAKGER